MCKKTLTVLVTCLILVVVPVVVLAVQNTNNCTPGQFCNPLGSGSLDLFIISVINFLLGLIGLLALLAIIVGGIRMIAAFGNDQALASAKKIVLWAILGLVTAALGWVIISLVRDFLGIPK